MPKVPTTPRKGLDGMSPREREFARLCREDPAAPKWQIAERAGFKGSKKVLTSTARRVLKVAAVQRAVFAPKTKAEALKDKTVDQMTDAELGLMVKQAWLDIVRSQGAAPGDRARAARMLGETIEGFFVPVRTENKTELTMEDIVASMGGAPPDHRKDQEEVH